MRMHSDAELDAQGLRCPEPLMLVRNKVRALSKGDILHIVATDPSTRRDFLDFCRFMGHELVHENTQEEKLHFWIKK